MSQKDIRDLMHPMRMLSPETTRGSVGKLEFPLPEKELAFMDAVRGGEYKRRLHDIRRILRDILKNAKDGPSGQTAEELAEYLMTKLINRTFPPQT